LATVVKTVAPLSVEPTNGVTVLKTPSVPKKLVFSETDE